MYTLSDLAYDLVWTVPDCTTPVLQAALGQRVINWHMNGWPEIPPAQNWQLTALALNILVSVVNDMTQFPMTKFPPALRGSLA